MSPDGLRSDNPALSPRPSTCVQGPHTPPRMAPHAGASLVSASPSLSLIFAPRSLSLFLLLSFWISECFTLFLIVAETAVRWRQGQAGPPEDRIARDGICPPAGSPLLFLRDPTFVSWWLRPRSVQPLLQGREQHLGEVFVVFICNKWPRRNLVTFL